MNNKAREVLLKILDSKSNDKNCSLYSLSLDFDVSTRTIRNYIKAVNAFLSTNALSPLRIIENGVIENENEISLVKQALQQSDFYNYKLSKEERKKIISLLLLLSKNYTTFSDISDYLYFSRVTIINDVAELKVDFKKGNLTVNSRPNKGINIKGDEEHRRDYLLNLTEKNDKFTEPNTILNEHLLNIISDKDIFEAVGKIISEQEQKYELFFSYDSYDFIYRLIYIIIIRSQYSADMKLISQSIDENNDDFYRISSDIIKYLVQYFSVPFNNLELETKYLAKHLGKLNYIKKRSNSNIIEVQMLTRKFIGNISEQMNYNLNHDFEFYENLSNHLASIMNKSVPDLDYDVAEVFEDILLNNSGIVNIIKNNLNIIEDYFNRVLEDIEVSYIVIHVLAAVERKKIKSIDMKVLLVCNLGIGTAQLLKVRLKKHFDFKYIEVFSSKEITNINTDNSDFIISTVKLPEKFDNTGYVKISAIMSDTDVVLIENKINEIQNNPSKYLRCIHNPNIDIAQMVEEIYSIFVDFKNVYGADKNTESNSIIPHANFNSNPDFQIKNAIKQTIDKYLSYSENCANSHSATWSVEQIYSDNSSPSLHELLTPEFIELDVEVKTIEEAIRYCGNILLKAGCIEEQYIDAMVESVEQNGDYIIISDEFALPHADLESGSKKVAMALIRLKDTIEFVSNPHSNLVQNKKVKYVCALSATDKYMHLKALFSLVNLLEIQDFKNMLASETSNVSISNRIKLFGYGTY